MAGGWKTVRVFISSTFRDMHNERDHLVRFVFPELKGRCRSNRVHLIEVDLRWGVSEKDAQDGRALDICLDEIDTCRPFFLGILGHRYGWTPPGHRRSITAQEIYHGVLHGNIPKQVVDVRRIIEEKMQDTPLSDEQKTCLVRNYKWNSETKKYLIRTDVATDDAILIQSIFEKYSIYQRDRSFFFFRTESLSRKLAGNQIQDFFESDNDSHERLESLKKEIVDAGLPYLEYDDLETFGQLVLNALWRRIELELEQSPAKEMDWLEQEAEFHELFMFDRTRRFIGRRELLDRMHAFCIKHTGSSLLVVTGEPGSGKSALMARHTEVLLRGHADWLVLPHFVGASSASTNLLQLLRRLCAHLNHVLGESIDVSENMQELVKLLPELLQRACGQKRIIIVLDAVNQLEKTDHAHGMQWLPADLPANVRFVVSTLAGEIEQTLSARKIKPDQATVTGLTESEIQELVQTYLQEIRHEFPNEKVKKTFYRKIEHGNPLYILVALEELRVFGKFEQLAVRVTQFPDSLPALFDQVLARIESDFDPALVRDCMVYLSCGRYGMTAEELQTLLKSHAPQLDPNSPAEKFPDMLWARLYRSFSSYLFERSGVIDFFHGQLKEAVGRRYLQKEADRNSTHRTLADYFETRWRETYLRAIDELPHQLLKVRDWDGLRRVLCDLRFVQAKSNAQMITGLIQDYTAALESWPHHEHVNPFLPPQKSFFSWSGDTVASHVFSRMNQTELAGEGSSVETFMSFVILNAHILKAHPEGTILRAMNYADGGDVVRHAWLIASEECSYDAQASKLTRPPTFQWRSPLLRTMVGHNSRITAISLSPDGTVAISHDEKGITRIWNTTNAECLKVLNENPETTFCIGKKGRHLAMAGIGGKVQILSVKDLQVRNELETAHPIRRMALASEDNLLFIGIGDGRLQVWELTNGTLVQEIATGSGDVTILDASEDGQLAATAGSDSTIRVWNIAKAAHIRDLAGHSGTVRALRLSHNGRTAVSGSDDWTIRLWNIGDGKCASILEGHSSGIASVECSPACRLVVSAGKWDRSLLIWDAEKGECLRALSAGSDFITCAALAINNGCIVAAGHRNGLLKLWDIAQAEIGGGP